MVRLAYITQPGRPQTGTPSRYADEEHGPRQHRGAVGDDIRPGVLDGQRGAVVRVHAHAAGGKDQLAPCGLGLQNGGSDPGGVIIADLVKNLSQP